MPNIIQFPKQAIENSLLCNMCGKSITEMWDVLQDFELKHECIPYTENSNFDGCNINLKLCNHCMEGLFKWLIEQCKINPISDNGLL